MAKDYIFLSDVLKQMSTLNAQGEAPPFSIDFRTMNRYSKKGGRLLSFPVARLVMTEKKKRELSINTLRFAKNEPKPQRKDPDHWGNKTRNIRVPEKPHPIKVHINNITAFNGVPVVF